MILDTIVEKRKERYALIKDNLEDIKAKAKERVIDNPNFFYDAISKDGISFICEIKKASPSKGLISKDFQYEKIAVEYNKAADAISVLTEPDFFMGSNEILTKVKSLVKIPVLRKDFVVYPYQVYEAKVIGADAVLLIMSVLGKEKAKEYLEIAHSIGIGALVEAHDEKEVLDAVEIGAKVVGVNNRNLKDFTIDMQNSIRLRNLAPASVKFVSESGIKERSDVEVLEKNNVDAVLIGETLMRQGIENIVNQINILRNGKD